MNNKYFVSDYLIFVGTIAASVLFLTYVINVSTDNNQPLAQNVPAKTVNTFDDVALGAQAAVVLDLTDGKTIFSKNSNAQLPLASLTKIMTTLVANENIPPQTLVKITPEAIATEGDSGLKVNESWLAKNLTDYTLQVSSNDGASALALSVASILSDKPSTTDFVRLMNEKARSLKLDQTYFINPTGLDTSVSGGVSGGYGSADDLASLIGAAVKEFPNMFEVTTKPEAEIDSLNYKHEAVATNKIAGELPFLVASKTGFTDLAGGNLAVVIDAGLMHPVAIVVLGSSEDGRFTDVKLLTEKTLEYLANGS